MARSRSGGDDQKQVLTITLVLFVLLSIILSIVAFFGYSEQGEKDKEIAGLKAKFKAAERDRDANAVAMVALKEMIGANLATKAEQEKLAGLRNQSKDADGKMTFENVTAPHKDITWDANQKVPEVTYMDRIKKLQAGVANSAKAEKALEEQKKKDDQEYQQNIAALKKANAEMKKALDDVAAQIQQKFDGVDKRYREHIEKLVASMPNFEAQERRSASWSRNVTKPWAP